MWAVGQSPMDILAPASEWHFDSPVGVDCSSPEPRCIWLAVLRSAAASVPSQPCLTPQKLCVGPQEGQQEHCRQPRAKGRRDGISSANENSRPVSGEGVVWKGPRTVVLRKNSQGFGFTLRHFIVYPPESALHASLKDEENGNGKGYQRGRLEPMDTIFVKNVREEGPAYRAGLCTGDRLVKVNGESVLGKTYSQVIGLIQNSGSVLELSIMPKDEDVLQLVSAYSQDAYLKGNEPYKGGAQDLPDPPPICYPHSKPQSLPTATTPPLAPMGQNHLDNWSCWSRQPKLSNVLDNRSGVAGPASRQREQEADVDTGTSRGSFAHQAEDTAYGVKRPCAVGQVRGRSFSSAAALASPLQFHFANHQAAINSASQSQAGLSKTERCQQALSDWYYSQTSAMSPRHRSFSQDRLAEVTSALGHHRAGWSHSASQDTLLLHSSHHQHIEPCPPGDWGASSGRARNSRSVEMLDWALLSPPSEKPAWIREAQHVLPCTEVQLGLGNRCGAGPASTASQPVSLHQQHPASRTQLAGQPRRLPPHTSGDQPVGYRSYSPSFYRKADRLMQAHSFRDPAYSGPHLSWMPTPKTSPPENIPTSLPGTSISTAPNSASKPQESVCRQTNHERAGVERTEAVSQFQEVVLRQKPHVGRRTTHVLQNPSYALPVDATESHGVPGEPQEGAPVAPRSSEGPRRVNGSLPALSVEEDSLASIPYIGNNKGSRRSSYMLAITTERSKSCDEGLNNFRDEGRVFSRLPKRVKSFFTDGSLESLRTAEETRSKRHSTSELGTITFSDVRKEGWLHYKQILTEKGKKLASGMWPWKRVFSVLRSHSLFLYKDKREAVLRGAALGTGAGAGHSDDEQSISIRGCLVDIAYSETRRKHALRLTTQDFCEYLLQAEDREDMLGWIKVIRESSKTDSEEFGFTRQALINKKLNDYKKQSLTASKPDLSPKLPRIKPPFLTVKTDTTAGGSSRSPKADGRDESSLPKSPWGITIIKGKGKKSGPKTFGVRLEECQPSTNNKFIPLIVETCCNLVEAMGLEYIGIYRVPGNNAMVSSLQEQLNKGADINLTEEKWQDLNVISSLLKSFFRKLPEPLFTDDKYNDFINANRMEKACDRLKTMKKLVHDLPDHYYHTLKFLTGHLKTVADHAEKNKMEPRNLALVFGPTLVRTSEDNMTEMVTHMPDRYKIVETLIQHHAWFFSEEFDADDTTPVDKGDVQPVPNIDHLLSNIGRTMQEASDSTNSDSAKSKGSFGSKWDLSAKDFTLSLLSAVTHRRRKRPITRLVGSSTDEDSEQEPIKNSSRGGHCPERNKEEEGEDKGVLANEGALAPRAEGEDDDGEEEEEIEDRRESTVARAESSGRPSEEEEEEGGAVARLSDKGGLGPAGREDARSIVSGYSTLSTLGRSLTSVGRGDEADDERSELVSETDNESGFASRTLTQERPEKLDVLPSCSSPSQRTSPPPPPPRLPLDTATCIGAGRRSTTPSSSSSSSSHRPHGRPSFSSHKLIQCDTLARRKHKGGKAKVRSLDVDQELERRAEVAEPAGATRRRAFTAPSPQALSSALSLFPSLDGEAEVFSPGAPSGRQSLAGQVRARFLGSAGDLRPVGLRKPMSPETRRKKSAWRRHTVVVHLETSTDGSVDATPSPRPQQTDVPRAKYGSTGPSGSLLSELTAAQPAPLSRFHQYL
ncbi:rho GTPase-activating protein 23-like isoform X2 [Scleropages formosus]|uniref:Rho GTPase activating protein 23 n=1 Tax=Scleropages formosus TaxID=113540 RepID=A0A8C9RNA1_SCLFO|nr:rho GTPase-activating protein 23-like isoform X2 [Scleropages formosus]